MPNNDGYATKVTIIKTTSHHGCEADTRMECAERSLTAYPWRSVATLRITPSGRQPRTYEIKLLARVYSLPREIVPTARSPGPNRQRERSASADLFLCVERVDMQRFVSPEAGHPQHNALHKTPTTSLVTGCCIGGSGSSKPTIRFVSSDICFAGPAMPRVYLQ